MSEALSDDTLDCMRCGACCTSPSARHVPVTGDDWDRLGDRADSLTDWTESHAFMRMTEGHCIALSIAPDDLRCTIYEQRPEVCRALERGGPACEVERATKLSTLGPRGRYAAPPRPSESAGAPPLVSHRGKA